MIPASSEDKLADDFFNGVETLPDMLGRRATLTPSASAYLIRGEDGKWIAISWQALLAEVSTLARHFLRQGIAPGLRVGILAGTSLGWERAQLALSACGAVVCGIDPYYPDGMLNRVVAALDLQHLVVADQTILSRLSEDNRRRLRFTSAIDDHDNHLRDSETTPLARHVDPAAAAVIALSSGSAGDPQPTVYSHAQVIHACRSIVALYPEVSASHRFVCWLPLANLFQRMVNLCVMAKGAVSYIVEDPRQVMEVLPVANPHLFIAVPRFCEKLHAGVAERLARKPLAAWLVNHAIALAAPWRGARARRTPVPLLKSLVGRIADRLVLRRLRQALGKDLKYIVTGAAPMPRRLLEWFEAIGVPVLEAYGVSENLVPVTANRFADRKLGSVGRPVADNEVRIAQDGEVQVRGFGVFLPTLGANHARAGRLTPDGFLATGDIGTFDADGFLTLHGRRGEAFKNEQGRWVSLLEVEAVLRQLPEVEHAVAIRMADGRLLGVLALNQAAGKNLSKRLAGQLEALPRAMRPVGFLVVSAGFLPATEELTSNLKVRRTVVAEKFATPLRELLERADQLSSQGFASLPIAIL